MRGMFAPSRKKNRKKGRNCGEAWTTRDRRNNMQHSSFPSPLINGCHKDAAPLVSESASTVKLEARVDLHTLQAWMGNSPAWSCDCAKVQQALLCDDSDLLCQRW